MKIDKLPSGSYRVQKQISGKRYSITFDHKPTQKEIAAAIEEKANSSVTLKNAPNKTFKECADRYFEVNKNILSAATYRNDKSRAEHLSDEFKNMLLGDIDNVVIQAELNRLSEKLSSKTVKNYFTVIRNVITLFIPKFVFDVTVIDRGSKLRKYIPKPAEAKMIMDASNDKYWIMFRLAAYGLRRSEALALVYPDDFDEEKHLMSINKAMVRGVDGWIVQPFNKTKKSTRFVPIDDELIQRIKAQGYVYQGDPNKILEYLHTKQKQLGIHDFRLHDFRGYFATELNQAGVASKDAQYLGGWSSASIMERSYMQDRIHDDEEIQQTVIDIISNKFT